MSTAVGGYLLTRYRNKISCCIIYYFMKKDIYKSYGSSKQLFKYRFNIQPRRATLYLLLTWIVIFLTYLFGLIAGCKQPELVGKHVSKTEYETVFCKFAYVGGLLFCHSIIRPHH